MTANRGLFVRNNGTVGTTPIEGRLVLASMVAENSPGVPRQGLLDQKVATLVTGSASNMSYNVGPCTPVLNRATNEGVYIFTLTGTTNVVTDAAPGTGSRWDLIYVKQSDLDKGDAVNTATVSVQKGTAGASPTKPYASLPPGAYVLAEALVQAGAANAADAKVTITQVWRYTALRGAPITVRNQAERDEITGTIGTLVRRLDYSPGYIEMHTGTAWSLPIDKPFAHMGRTGSFQNGFNASTQTAVQFSAAQILKGGFTFDDAADAVVVPVSGHYRVTVQGMFTGSSGNLNIAVAWKNNASTTNIGGPASGPKPDGNDVRYTATAIVPLNAGDKVGMVQQSVASAWGTTGWDGSYVELEYISAL